ncbi:hypothetical protein BH10ACT1_BH10ACT1_19910 [soil metagenome]
MDDVASSATQRFRYSKWPSVDLPLPDIHTWAGELGADGWVDEYATDRAAPRSEVRPAPQDLHIFEFADVDPRRLSSILEFAREVGLPGPSLVQEPHADVKGEAFAGIEESNYQGEILRVAVGLGIEAPDLGKRPHLGSWHHAELAYRVLLMRQFVASVKAISDGAPLALVWNVDDAPSEGPGFDVWPTDAESIARGVFMSLLNAGTSRFNVRITSESWPDTKRWSSYEIGCLAVMNDLSAGAHYRTCENETCRRVFPRQRGRSEAGQHRTVGVKFCMPSCARAQSQRERRRKTKREKEQG